MSIQANPIEPSADNWAGKKTTIPADVGNTLTILASRLTVILRRRVTYLETAEILDSATDDELTDMVRRYQAANNDSIRDRTR